MKILMINSVCGIRSTGRICTDIADALEKKGYEVKIAYGRFDVPEKYQKYAIKIGNQLGVYFHIGQSLLMDNSGLLNKRATEKFIEWVKEYDPDVIHLHNIHGYYIHIPTLFEYLKKCNKTIFWTLHDCWSFTGHCAYFDYINCKKWENGCYDCKLKHSYPPSLLLDKSKENYLLKKELFTNISNMTLITPSEWLASLVNQSFLKEYTVKVIHNQINHTIFHPIESNLKNQYCIFDKKILLGVASVWEKRKGLDDFIQLSKLISTDYMIVLIGLNNKQLKLLPKNIIGIRHTSNAEELAQWYTCADVFLNLTYEDNYPTTNLESIACGTPVITYNTGGSPESANYYGITVKKGDLQAIIEILNSEEYKKCEKKEVPDTFIEDYISLYIGEKRNESRN